MWCVCISDACSSFNLDKNGGLDRIKQREYEKSALQQTNKNKTWQKRNERIFSILTHLQNARENCVFFEDEDGTKKKTKNRRRQSMYHIAAAKMLFHSFFPTFLFISIEIGRDSEFHTEIKTNNCVLCVFSDEQWR